MKTCLLIAEADRVLCHLVMFLTVFFSTGCTKCNTAATKNILLLMAGLFIGFLVKKGAAFRKASSVSKMSFTLPCLMRRVEKSQATLAFFGGFQDLHLVW